ncbi:LPXTG cell wall anchor domain-containing protein [Vagococcus salmoninarum]
MLVLLLVVSWGVFSHQGRTTATTSERSQVSPNPPPDSAGGPSRLPQTGNNQQVYLQVAGFLLLTCLVCWGKGRFSLKKGGSQ